MQVLLLGGSGTIGRATCAALLARGHVVTTILRATAPAPPEGAIRRDADVADPGALRRALAGCQFDALVSCLASRTGRADDAWALDHAATLDAMQVARDAGAGHVVLLSALCVQRPRLPFQRAKLAAEVAVRESGLRYSIARPTAFFKSLSGQIDRLRAGKPFLVFGDGRLTACKPVSNRDLAAYLADCLADPARWDRTLPVGGPGPALTPLDQGAMLFDLLERPPRIRHVPPRLLTGIASSLEIAGRLSQRARNAAQMARIGQYYATESMLVWTGDRYDADATPETGHDTLRDHYRRLILNARSADLGEHSVFTRKRSR